VKKEAINPHGKDKNRRRLKVHLYAAGPREEEKNPHTSRRAAEKKEVKGTDQPNPVL